MGKRRWDEISPSKLSLWFNGCKLASFFKYVDEERPMPVASLAMVLGKEIHYMLEQFYKKNFKSEESFAKFFSRRWGEVIAGNYIRDKRILANLEKRVIGEWIDNAGNLRKTEIGNHTKLFWTEDVEEAKSIFFAYMNIGKGILKRFYLRHKDKKPPIHLENQFRFNFRGYEMFGIVDRIDEHKGRIIITDYKTGKSTLRDSFVLHREHQLTTYDLGYRSKVDYDGEIVLLLYHLRSGQVYITRRNKEDADYLEMLCEKYTREFNGALKRKRFEPFFSFQCNFCEYIQTCAKYSFKPDGSRRLSFGERSEDIDLWTGWDLGSKD